MRNGNSIRVLDIGGCYCSSIANTLCGQDNTEHDQSHGDSEIGDVMTFEWTIKTIFYILLSISVLMAMILWYASMNPGLEGGVFYFLYRIFTFLGKPVV